MKNAAGPFTGMFFFPKIFIFPEIAVVQMLFLGTETLFSPLNEFLTRSIAITGSFSSGRSAARAAFSHSFPRQQQITRSVSCSPLLHHHPTQHYITILRCGELTSPLPAVPTKSPVLGVLQNAADNSLRPSSSSSLIAARKYPNSHHPWV